MKAKKFIHADTARYLKARKYILWLTLFPLFQCSLIAALITIVNLRHFYERGYFLIALYGTAAAAVAGTLIFYAVYIIIEILVKRNARYTFFDVGSKALVFSRYDGEAFGGGRRRASRKLYVIPLSSLEKIGYSEKKNKVFLETEPNAEHKIREYIDNSERLNYRFSDGFPEFESWWYNENGYKPLSSLVIPGVFGKAEKLSEIIALAKRDFDDAPKPAPYVHKESDFIKRKKAFDRLKKLQKW